MIQTERFAVQGVLVDPIQRTQKGVEIIIEHGRIYDVCERNDIKGPYILPGFVDAHVHIESSMLIPSRFANMAVRHGTVGVVSDPHEVANAAGVEGIRFMLNDAKKVPLNFFFGVPSCVPASPFEKSGAVIDAEQVQRLLEGREFYFLAEMMNFPGVIYKDPEVLSKIASAQKNKLPIDGHAPGLRGEDLTTYVKSGISTDHECVSLEEAKEKIMHGMKVLIREGSAARDFDMLIPLLQEHSDMLMFCTDDCHPDYLKLGHINKLVSRAVMAGYDVYNAIKVATVNPVRHYNLPIGLLKKGDKADFVIVQDLKEFDVLANYVNGVAVFSRNKTLFEVQPSIAPEFTFRKTYPENSLSIKAIGDAMKVIKASDGELYTDVMKVACAKGKEVLVDTDKDILKVVLLDRYSESPPVIAFIHGFGLKKGALACSIAHDSHHIVAVGCDDASLEAALQWVVTHRGGLCYNDTKTTEGIALPYFGLMTDGDGDSIALNYEQLSQKVKQQGSPLSAPFMTLSFMALTVIPKLKIYHDGLFDGLRFEKTELFDSL